MASGWKVLGGFQPDGAVLELYTGVSPENQPPAFAPETNLTLASSPRRPMAAHSRTRASAIDPRRSPTPSTLISRAVFRILGLGVVSIRMNRNPETNRN